MDTVHFYRTDLDWDQDLPEALIGLFENFSHDFCSPYFGNPVVIGGYYVLICDTNVYR